MGKVIMNKVYIIAEAGVNHDGKFDVAIELIDRAAEAGADAVKFQTFIPENVISKRAKKAEYQLDTTNKNESQLDMVKKLCLQPDDFKRLQQHCNIKNIEFLSSPFDMDSIDTLTDLNLTTIKIPSGEITNLPYLRKIGSLNINIILSTGMSTITDISNCIDILIKSGTLRENISLLHCNTEYPTPPCDVNLNAIATLKKTFKLKTGFSDHTRGIHFPIAAVTLGAEIIEKHFTLDKTLEGPDHRASIDPEELTAMVKHIRDIELGMGTGIKEPTASETKNIEIARKSIIAKVSIKKGDVFTIDNITTKRPGTGISPMDWDIVIGKPAEKDYQEDDII